MSTTPTTATTPATAPRPAPDPVTRRRPGPHWGRIVFGLLLTAGGAGWLLDSLSAPVPWHLFPAAGLVVVGAVLLLSLAGGTGRADVVVIGIVLLVVAVAVGAGADRFAGPLGDRTIGPAGWPGPTRISAGTVTVDLTDTTLPTNGRLDVAVGAGRVVLRLPAEAPVQVRSTVVLGTIVVDGVAVGQGVDLDWTAPGTAVAPVTVEIAVGAGDVEVIRERT